MPSTYSEVRQRLTSGISERASRAIKGAGESSYRGSRSSGSFYSDNEDLGSLVQKYNASVRGWSFSAIRLIATACADQPIRVGIQRGKKKQRKFVDFTRSPSFVKAISEALDVVHVHDIIDLIEMPNAFAAGTEYGLKFCTVFSLCATGKAYWLVSGFQNTTNVYYIPAHWVKYADGRQCIQPPDRSEPMPIMPDELLIPFVVPDPADPRTCLSYLQTQAKPVNIDDEIQTSQSVSIKNTIHPSLAIRMGRLKDPNGVEQPVVLTPEQRSQFYESLLSGLGGATRYGTPVLLDALVEEVIPLIAKPAELDYANSGKSTRERIFLAFGVNPIVAGLVEGANRATSYVAHEQFYKTVVNPLLNQMSQTLTKYLAPRFNSERKRLYVWFEEAVPYDSDADRRNKRDLATFGALTKNEYRESFNLPPVDGGDKLIEPKPMAAAGAGRPPST